MEDPGARSDPAAGGGETAGGAGGHAEPHGPGEALPALLGRIARLVDDPDPAATIAHRSLTLLRANTGADAAAFLRFDALKASVLAIVADDERTVEAIAGVLENLPTEAPSVRLTLESDVALELDFHDPVMGPPAVAGRIMELGFDRLWAIPAASGSRTVPGALGLLWRGDRPMPRFDPVDLGHLGRVVGAVVNSAMLRDAMRAEIARRSELEEAARLAGHVVEQARTAIVVTDMNRRVTAWNPAAERIYGLTAAEAVGVPLADLLVTFRPDGSELGPSIRDQVLAGEPFTDRVLQRIVSGPLAGRELLIDPVVTALRDAQGRVLGLVALNRDVTATGRLEAELSELGSLAIATGSARSTQEVADAALEVLSRATGAAAGLILAPADDGIVAAGTRGVGPELIERIVGYGRIGERLTAALADPGAILFANVDEAPLRPEVAAAIRAEGIRHVMVVGLRVAGELTGILALGWRSEPVRPGGPAILQAAALIAAALAGTRSLLRAEASEQRYRSLFGHLPIACLAIRPDGRIAEANAAAERLFGYPRGGLEDRPVADLTTDATRGDPESVEARRADGAVGTGWREFGRRANGSRFPIEVTVTQATLGADVVALAMVRDLSEQQRLQAELTQAQKMEALGQLVSGVAHELNNPLASIVAFSQLIRRDDRLPDDMRGDADLLVQEADRTRRIVQNLLDFARQRPPERHATRLGLLVGSVLELQAYSFSTGRIEVVADIPDDLPLVEVDRPQIQQVLLNLTLNAIQAIQADRGSGRIVIRARAVADEGEDRILLTVADDGAGVPDPMRSRIFDPFFTTKPPGHGTGLGLSVSFGIVGAHRGRLWHEPGPDGAGSVFHLELPAAARPVPESGAAAPGPAPAHWAETAVGSQPSDELPRVLVLDDEPAIRTFLVKALHVAGIEAVVAQDGPSALEIIRTTPIDALLLDHRMAGMAGTDVYLAVVEARPDLAGRAVFMSGDVLNPELRAFAIERGIGLLAKPFDVDAVGRAVRDVLPVQGPP